MGTKEGKVDGIASIKHIASSRNDSTTDISVMQIECEWKSSGIQAKQSFTFWAAKHVSSLALPLSLEDTLDRRKGSRNPRGNAMSKILGLASLFATHSIPQTTLAAYIM
jgi:hypothetical protein